MAGELQRLAPLAARDEKALPQIEAILEFAARARLAAAESAEWLERVILYDAPRVRKTAGSQTFWDDPNDCRRTKELFSDFREKHEAIAAELRTEALVGVLPYAEGFVHGYERERKAAGKADFDDLLVWARDLLRTSAEARSYFRRRFPCLLVDEFQDTDPIQAEIALYIASEGDPGERWLDLRPDPGRLVVVGDPKQSIYRFRRADIAVYDAVRHGPLAASERQLRQNFRSHAGVLEWANEVFDRVLVEEEGVQPGNVPLEAVPEPFSEAASSIVVVHGDLYEKPAEIRAEEARLVAATIRKAVDEGWSVRDPETGGERAVRYGDIVCLFPARTDLELLTEALAAQGIPFRSEGARTFFRRQEVRDLATCLHAIDDPADRVSLYAALRSSAFSCSDEDIFLFTVAGGALDYRPPAEVGPDAVREAMTTLRDLHYLRAGVSLAALVRAVLDRTRLVEIALDDLDGLQSAANLLKLAERARAFSASGGGGLRAFARWLKESQEGAAELEEAGIAEWTDDIVRLLTIHGAKGLEFPLVALWGIAGERQGPRGSIPDPDGHRLHLRFGPADGRHFSTPGYDAAYDLEKHQADAEDLRLLYVAVTRARDRLVVPVAAPEKKHGPLLGALFPSLPGREAAGQSIDGCRVLDATALPPPRAEDDTEPPQAGAPAVETALAARTAWVEAREELRRAADREIVIVPATETEGAATLPAAALLGADDAPLIAGAGPPLEIGEVLHRVLELCDLARPDDLPPLVDSLCVTAGVAQHADDVLALARACLESPVTGRALASAACWREVPYTIPLDGGYGTGRIDLVFRENGGLVIVDWKTDSVGPEGMKAAAEAHRAQAEAYAGALTAATGLGVSEVTLVFPRARGEIAVGLGAGT